MVHKIRHKISRYSSSRPTAFFLLLFIFISACSNANNTSPETQNAGSEVSEVSNDEDAGRSQDTAPEPEPESQPEAEPGQIALFGVFEKTVTNVNTYDNPFDFDEIELKTEFISPSKNVTPFYGFYDGNGQGGQEGSVWKMRFMPDEIGTWTYSYTWSDGTTGGSGSFHVVDLGLTGPIIEDERNRKSWKTVNGDNFIPFFTSGPRFDQVSDSRMNDMLDYLKNDLGAKGVANGLRNIVWLDCENDFSCSPHQNIFSLENWKRLDQFLSKLKQRDLSANFRFYSDDENKPLFDGKSDKERLLFKYTMARLAAHTNILFDSGIDILEYRSVSWNDWFAQELRRIDPWDHFVGSRHGGGSGNFECPECTYDARGEVHPGYATLLSIMEDTDKPIFSTEHWREDFRRGNFDKNSIRKIMWHNAMVGGSGYFIGGEQGNLQLENYTSDLDAPEQLKAYSDFWHGTIKNWGHFVVCNEDLSNGYCFAEKGETYVLYLENGGSATLELGPFLGLFSTQWLNPRTGDRFNGNMIDGGETVTLEAADPNDWVVYIKRNDIVSKPHIKKK